MGNAAVTVETAETVLRAVRLVAVGHRPRTPSRTASTRNATESLRYCTSSGRDRRRIARCWRRRGSMQAWFKLREVGAAGPPHVEPPMQLFRLIACQGCGERVSSSDGPRLPTPPQQSHAQLSCACDCEDPVSKLEGARATARSPVWQHPGHHRRTPALQQPCCQGVPAAMPPLPIDSRDPYVTCHIGCTADGSRSGMTSAWTTIHRYTGCISTPCAALTSPIARCTLTLQGAARARPVSLAFAI